ncbi:putative translocator protein like protein [Xylona heveae TC161]|uniref:Putative translocator protein like protein n=1 Tax=Xylona heveae (strain CBS 132557 / TC161) TaxID=1328760 RepID=A0A165HMZ3_XYLHT|nr:putative translocator protein like protein [Xylona heveae TC161]KZF23754.1 putative translocator protein like protein [Xylona heveae TC161]
MTSYIPSITLPAQVFAQPAVSILLPIALGTGVGFSVKPKETQETYLALKQPPYRPPPKIFPPVWTVLYGLMGFSAYRAWTTGMASLDPQKVLLTKQGATLYTIQLALNLVWMPLFYELKRPIEATVDIVALTGVTGYLTYIWGQVDEVAGWALTPYLAWLGFATYLSAGTGYLNGWTFADKERNVPPSTKSEHTKYVDEEPEKK